MKGGTWGHIDHFKNLGFNDIGGGVLGRRE